MAIFIISRRPLAPFNEKAWSYRNRFTSDNAAVSAEVKRDAAYRALQRRAEAMAHSWRVAEPDSQFRVMDSGVNTMSDKFGPFVDAPADVPIIPGDEDGPVGRVIDPSVLPTTAWARRLITKAERDLHRSLSPGERRDLLMDNTDWGRDVIVTVVEQLEAVS